MLLTARSIRALPLQTRRSSLAIQGARQMHIQSIPMWKGSSNNYAYVVKDEKTREAVIIDPANPAEVLPVLQKRVDAGDIKLKAIINTHHHWDHAGGNRKILEAFKDIKVIGGKDCEAVTSTPDHGSTLKIGDDISVQALHTPCHTQDSICWYMTEDKERVVFTGDTLFIGGTPQEMHKALNETLSALPDDTKVFPGHEYTKSNAKFLAKISPTDAVKKLQKFAEENEETQGKFTIGDEKSYNAFMRVTVSPNHAGCDAITDMIQNPLIQQATNKQDPVDVMSALREMKNSM